MGGRFTGVAVFLVVALACTGCSRTDDAGRSATATVASGVGPVPVGRVFVERPDGLTALEVTAKPTKAHGRSPEGVEATGEPVSLTSPTGARVGRIRIGFPVPPDTDPATVLVGSLVDGEWVPEPTEFDASRRVAFAETDHLSVWTLLVGGAVKIVGTLGRVLNDVVGLGTIGAPPDCGGQAVTPTPVSVALGSGVDPEEFRLESCAYRRDGQLRVRLADRRPIGIELTLPEGVRRVDGSIPGAGDLAAEILAGVNRRLGIQAVLVPSGGWIELAVPAQATIEAFVNNSALVWSALFAVAANVEGLWKAVAVLAQSGDILADVANADWREAVRGGLVALLEVAGKQGVKGIGKLATSVAVALVGSAFLAVRGVIDSFRFSTLRATITIGGPAAGPFAGEWFAHAAKFVIRPDGSFDMAFRTYRDCRVGSPPPCDGPSGMGFVELTGRLEQRGPTTATGVVETSNAPSDVLPGTPIALTLRPAEDRFDVRLAGFNGGEAYSFCGPKAAVGACGA